MCKCIKGFLIDLVDGDGFTVKERGYEVEEGSIWEADESVSRIVRGAVKLINKDLGWCEVSTKTLEEHFIKNG